MEVKYWEANGIHYREIISRQYRTLLLLGNEYAKRGARVWINNFDMCEGRWVLTVEEKDIAA